MSRKTRTVTVPGLVVGSDEKEVYLEAHYTHETIESCYNEAPGIYLEALYWDRPDGMRIAIGWSDESWLDCTGGVFDQLHAAEAH